MYRVKVLSSGKYHNVVVGNRYCFFKKDAIELANLFNESGCDLIIEKFVHCGRIFFWTSGLEEVRIYEDWAEDEETIILYRPITKKEYKNL